MQKKLKRKLKLLVTLAAIAGIFLSIHIAINSNAVQRAVIGLAAGKNLKIEPSGLKLNFLSRKVTAKNINVENRETGLKISASGIEIKLSLLGLVRGKVILPHFIIESTEINLPKEAGKKREKISIKKLFLLQNLFIEVGMINNAVINIADDSAVLSDMLSFQFKPKFGGDVELALNLQGAGFKKGSKLTSLASFKLEGKTKLTSWSDSPPFINSIQGKLYLQDLKSGDVNISNFESGFALNDKKVTISDLKMIKDARPINGFFMADLDTKTFKAELNIPELIKFPRLGSDSPTIDTSGFIKGELSFEGKGFSPKDSAGSAQIKLFHERNKLIPINIESAPTWKNGVITLNGTKLSLDTGTVTADGSINIAAKKFDMDFDIKNVPLEAAFGRFYDINFHPIFGRANGSAKLTGWAKEFNIKGSAETIAESGYYKITSEKVFSDINATYNEFELKGRITQHEKQTASVNLNIKFGKKTPGLPRPKNIHLTAEISDYSLGESFAEYKLSGTGAGKLIIDGPPQSYKGKISATILDGAFSGISFNKASANAEMLYKKIKFTDGEFILPNIQPAPFSSPIQMDFFTGGFHIFGEPIEAVSFDATYKNEPGSWQISNISFHDLKIKGSYAPKGSSSLKIAGSIDGSHLQAFKEHLREADGRFYVDFEYSGQALNPNLDGKFIFDGNTLFPRAFGTRLENVYGELLFKGHAIKSDYLTGNTETGDFVVKGSIEHKNFEFKNFDINLNANSFRYTSLDGAFKSELNADISWAGSKESSLLKGDITILDGRYTKDFTLFENIIKAPPAPPKKEGILDSDATKLDLSIRNAGDLMIKNNIGEVWLKTDVIVTGTAKRPSITGVIETVEGKLRFFGRDFTVTRGFIEYHAPYANPYLEITAEHEVPTITDLVITATLHGRLDNLVLDLQATKPLEKRDIVSLLLFGVTETEIRETQWSYQFGPSVAAAQVSHLIERPITKLAHLDIFRIEAAGGPAESSNGDYSSQNTQISRMYLGKKLTDRMTVEFVTDVNTEDAQQTLKAEYLLTDFLVLRGERSSGQKYKLNVLLRFRER